MNEGKPNIDEIFVAALEKRTLEERTRYLDEVCGERGEIREQIERLLEAHPRVGNFMEYPVVGIDTTIDLPENAERGGTVLSTRHLPPQVGNGGVDRSESHHRTIGHYRLLCELGAGGMGLVYEAEDLRSGRHVALKLVTISRVSSPSCLNRFRLEGRLASRIVHPRSVFVIEAGEADSVPFIAMELMLGVTLQVLIEREGPLNHRDAVMKILDVIEGLEEAHRLDVLHRDVKPSNCYLDNAGRVKIGDYGLSKSLSVDARLTQEGQFLGTPLYASPEQIKKEPIDHRSDIYSVAATLCFLLTGRPPYQADDATATMARVVSSPPPSLRSLQPEIPKALEEVVLKGLHRDPRCRWQTMADFKHALLPFGTDALSPAGLGLRTASYLVDWFVTLLLVVVGSGALHGSEPFGVTSYVFETTPWLFYFVILEGLWGASIGKWLFRLRVVRANRFSPPGILRALFRSGVFLAIWLPYDVFVHFTEYGDINVWLTDVALPATALFLVISTMRFRNGFRGPHELLSGTRVVQMPTAMAIAEATSPECQSLNIGQSPVSDVPNELGAYKVIGEVTGLVEPRLLIADDSELERQVWIVLDLPITAATRREVWRPTRLAWLAGGILNKCRWDAFLAPDGAPLKDVVDRCRPLSWADARHVLKQLAEELSSACADETLPNSLHVSQLWIRHGGRVQLLDVNPSAHEDFETVDASDQERSLSLLRDATILALEGKLDPKREQSMSAASRSGRWIHARIPLHARPILSRLWSSKQQYNRIDQFLNEINTVLHRSPTVSPAMRASRLVMLAPVLLLLLLFMFFLSIAGPGINIELLTESIYRDEALLYAFEQPDLRKKLHSTLANSEARSNGAVRPQAYEHLHNQVGRRLNDNRAELIRRFGATPDWRKGLMLGFSDDKLDPRLAARSPSPLTFRHESMAPTSADFEIVVEDTMQAASPVTVFAANDLVEVARQPEYLRFWAAIGVSVITPIFVSTLHIAYMFLVAGGLTYAATGTCLVRSSGRKALRIQHAARAAILWIPLWTGFVTATWVDACAYEHQWGVVLSLSIIPSFICIYTFLAIRFPTRSAADFLVGTYLVPR